jgi:hypothetical protein
VGINSGSFAATPSSAALTAAAFPISGTIRSYTIVVAFSGTVSVGSGGTYPSLTNPGGLFEAINNSVLGGNTTADIISDLSAETGAIALNQWIEEGGSGFTLLIQPGAGFNQRRRPGDNRRLEQCYDFTQPEHQESPHRQRHSRDLAFQPGSRSGRRGQHHKEHQSRRRRRSKRQRQHKLWYPCQRRHDQPQFFGGRQR